MPAPAPHHSRYWTALSVLLVGAGLALWLVQGDVQLWFHAWRQVLALQHLSADLTTLGLLIVGMILSWSSAGLLTTLLKNSGPLAAQTGLIFGKAAAFFPIHALTWAFLGQWIGKLGHPIWTLMPTEIATTHLPALDHLALSLWTWVPALALLCLPLTGQWLSLLLRTTPPSPPATEAEEIIERNVSTPHLFSPQREEGQLPGPSIIQWTTSAQLPPPARMAKSSQPEPSPSPVQPGLWSSGLLAIVLLIIIEDTLGLSGTAAALAQHWRAHDLTAAASSLLSLTCITLLWTLIVGGPSPWSVKTPRHGLAALLKVIAWSLLLLTLATSSFRLPLPWFQVISADTAFTSPVTALWAGLPPMLCALSFWLLGHIISPRNPPPTHA